MPRALLTGGTGSRQKLLHADIAKSTWDAGGGWEEGEHVAAHKQSSMGNVTQHMMTTGAWCDAT